MGLIDTACVSEKAGLDRQIDKLLERNIGYLVADAGYTDLNRTEQLAKEGLLLLTPVIGAKSDRALHYVESLNQSAQLRSYQHNRKVAIEPIFALRQLLRHTQSQATAGESKRECIYLFDARSGLASTGDVGQFYLGAAFEKCHT